MSDEKLSPERAARLLRAKAAELEQIAYANQHPAHAGICAIDLAIDVALIATLLADHIERVELVEIGDPLFHEDGTPWRADP